VVSEDGLRDALTVSYAAVGWSAVSGAVSIGVGISAHSTALVGTGADVLADLLSSTFLIWRFRAERRGSHLPHVVERRAQVVAATCLLVVALGLAVAASVRLGAGHGAEASAAGTVVAAVSVAVLPLFAFAKYRIAPRVPSRGLRVDGHISLVGAATALCSLVGLVLTHAYGWTAADPVAALAIAVLAGVTGGYELWAEDD
jgi:divalent metal cation (Fe/Co/Zn/Cd) transporter